MDKDLATLAKDSPTVLQDAGKPYSFKYKTESNLRWGF